MDEELYDEFGNYIGPELSGSDSEAFDSESSDSESGPESGGDAEGDELALLGDVSAAAATNAAAAGQQIVLQEDKQYYPDASEVYPDAETRVEDEDTQPITEPIIKPVKAKVFSVLEKEVPELNYSLEFMTTLMETTSLIRNIAVVGHLHHGKTSLLDLLIEQTHKESWPLHGQRRYTDTRKDEQERGISLKACPITVVLPDIRGKHFLLNVIDTPGHPNFSGEVTASLRAADGCIVVVDVVEGVMLQTERLLKHVCQAGIPITLVLSKMDRLITELRLPPTDAFHKICHVIQEVNNILATFSLGNSTNSSTARVSPELGNVAFTSSTDGWSFTLLSFAEHYSRWHGNVDATAFARRLWGDIFFDAETRQFSKTRANSSMKRTFVEFILEPLYKVYSQVLGEHEDELAKTLSELHIKVKKTELRMDPAPLIKIVMSRFFGQKHRVEGIVSMVTNHLPTPKTGAPTKVSRVYSGSQDSALSLAMKQCKSDAPVMFNVVKMFPSPDGKTFGAFGRLFSGTLSPAQNVSVLGEGYSEYDEEDCVTCRVTSVAVMQGRYRVNISRAIAGNLVMLEGIDASIMKTATVCSLDANTYSSTSGDVPSGESEALAIFKPLVFDTISVVKIAVEPLRPSELPKMLEGLRNVNKSYPLAHTKVEESGEHVIYSTGELHADSIMYDLRCLFSEVEIKVADPCVSFCETVSETQTPNKHNKLTLIAEPLDKGLAEDIESGAINSDWDKKSLGDFFQKKYDWDLLAARNVWGFGASEKKGPNVLIDDTLSGEVDKTLLDNVREHIVQGFQWACREGPLCEEPMRNVKFNVVDAAISKSAMLRGGAQIIPTARRVAYSSFLVAAPRLMEPVYYIEVLAPPDAVPAVYTVLSRRRGHVTRDVPRPGTPFYTVHAFIPVIESFGFETDLRVHTQGLAFCMQVFDHWSIVPGDPLDQSVVLRPLEPSPVQDLAREFMVKTRRRKGLSETLNQSKFFDDPLLLQMAQEEQLMEESEAFSGYN